MDVHYSLKNFSEQEKVMLGQYVEKKLPSLEHAATRFSPPPHILEIRAEQFTKKKAFNVSLHLKTSRGVVLSSEDDHTIAEALDLAKDKLVRQLTKK
mgnify:CR=1 FL=1